MTIPTALDTTHQHIKDWQEDEIDALRRQDQPRANVCRKIIAALERLAAELHGTVAA